MSMNRQYLRILRTGYETQSAVPVLSPVLGTQLLIMSMIAYNGSSSSCDIALGIGFNNSTWSLYAVGASVVNQTTNIQAGSAVTLFDTTNNHGYIVQGKRKFSEVRFNVSQASTGSPVYTYQYWNGASWASLTLFSTPNYASTGQKTLVFNSPSDWTVGAGGLGPDETQYSIRVLATTAPTQAVQANSMTAIKIIVFREAIGTKQHLEVLFKERQLLLESGEALYPYFSVADAKNAVEVSYQQNP